MSRFLLLPLLLLTSVALHAQSPQATRLNPAADPQPRNEWMVRHVQYVENVKKSNPDLVFLGDSITQGWDGSGKAVWAETYAPLKAVNIGIGGDRTENVLWRLQNGGLEGTKPKVVVLMIGTNNCSRGDTAPEIAEGIDVILKDIGKRSPSTKILLLGIFPRDEKPGTPYRAKITEINGMISKLDDEKTVYYLDIGEKFLQPDGTISREIMPDLLHLSPKGYQIWKDAIADKLAALLK